MFGLIEDAFFQLWCVRTSHELLDHLPFRELNIAAILDEYLLLLFILELIGKLVIEISRLHRGSWRKGTKEILTQM